MSGPTIPGEDPPLSPLGTIAYFSRRSAELSDQDLAELMGRAAKRNRSLGITGVLFFDGDRFLQILEGDRRAVTEVYGDIVLDPRHGRLVKACDCAISERAFATWAMRLVTTADIALDERILLLDAMEKVDGRGGGATDVPDFADVRARAASIMRGVAPPT